MTRKIMLFISSYIPLYILMILKNIFERITRGGKFVNIRTKMNNCILFDEINDYAIIIITLICIVSFLYLKRKIKVTVGEKYYVVLSVKDETSNNYFNYISVYLLSCLGLSLNNIVDVFILVFLMGIVGFIYISNNMTYMNPTLNMMGYKVFNAVLYSMSTHEEIDSIIVAKSNVSIEKEKTIIGTGKYGFIVVNKNFGEEATI